MLGHPFVVLPIVVRTKEHDLHQPLNHDWLLAEYFTWQVLKESPALALPTIGDEYYPTFVEYPGSVCVGRWTFSDTVCNNCRLLAWHVASKI